MLLWMLFIFTLQALGSWAVNKYFRWSYWHHIVFLLFLAIHFFILPPLWVSYNIPDDVNCGNPALGIVLTGWFVGIVGTLTIHLIYLAFKERKKIKSLPGDELW